MSGAEFRVDPAALRAHAQRVRSISGQADTAVQAANDVAFSPETYGKIGAMLVYPLMAPLDAAGVAATQAGKDTLDGIATGVDAMATSYDTTDQAVASAMKGLQG